MATVERVHSRRSADRPHPRARRARSHKLRNSFLVLLILSCVAVYFAPVIIARTPLRNWLVQTAVAPNGTITLGSTSLGWFSPVSTQNLDVRDAEGKSVVAVEEFATEKSLIALLLDLGDLGQLRVTKPSIHLVAYENDTNLERVFASLLSSEGESSVTAKLNVTGGTFVIDDAVDARQYAVKDLNADCTLGDAAEGIVLAATGTIQGESSPGQFEIDLHTTGSDAHGPLAAGKFKCRTTALPLDLVDPLLRRAVDDARLSGQLSTDLDGAWGALAENGEASIHGDITLADLRFAAAAIGPDEIQLARVDVPCHIRQQGEQIAIDELAIDCELGKVALTGTLKSNDFSAENVAAALARENYQLNGKIDLAKLARMLPKTLMIREGTEITAGQVEIAATAKQQPSGTSWTGLVETSRLAATANGRPIEWEKPLALQFAIAETSDGIIIDRAVCTSDFLQVSAAGSMGELSTSAEFDLARLIAELRQFSDLNNIQLDGQGRARLTIKRQGDHGFAAAADFQAQGFRWITAHSRPWTEDRVTATATVEGQLAGSSLKEIRAAHLTVDAGGDHLETRLRSPIVDPRNATWPLACSWRGQLNQWPARLESCLGLTGWDLAGSGALQADVDATPAKITIKKSQVELSQLRVHGGGWFVTEPAVSATAAGQWDAATGRVELTSARLDAGTAVAVVDRATLESSDGKWNLDGGKIHAEGELAQFAAWRQDPRAPASWRVSGRVNGDAELRHAGSETSGRVNAMIDHLQVVDAAQTPPRGTPAAVWQEPRLTLVASGNYQHDAELLKLEAIEVASNALRLDAAGTLDTHQGGGNVNVKGSVGYDWDQLAVLLRPYLGEGVRITGRQSREFALNGRLTGPLTNPDSWKQIAGNAALGWNSIDLYGLHVGRGDITAKLANGQVRTEPIDLEISEGRLTVAPVARISPSPAEMFLPSGPLLTNVRLSPELCSRGLRFVAPLLADATVAEGTFSVTLDGGRVPLFDPAAGDIGGRMVMRGQVKPGIIAREFVGIIKELITVLQRGKLPDLGGLDGSLVSVDNSNVEFRMVNRRVYHRGLKITVGTTPVTTEGSVGLDESLSLVAEVPINARLLGADLSLGALEGRSLKIPIGGTLKNPQLDKRALADITRQLIENAARDVLRDGLNRGLEQLFKP